MLFPTTLVGSYPQPEWLIDRRKLAEPWLHEAQDDATLLAIRATVAFGKMTAMVAAAKLLRAEFGGHADL